MANESLRQIREQIDERVAARMRSEHWPGAALGIEWGSEVELRAYGHANLEHRIPVHEETVFRIGSLTKQYTAALILKLREDGKLGLEDDVSRYLPEYPTGGRHVSVHHLLAHTSGIPNVTTLPSFRERIREDLPPEAVLEMFQEQPFRFEPGEDFEYSNSNYLLLGLIIEKVLGGPYSDCIREHVFSPLGLDHTYYMNDSPIIPGRAAGYAWESGEWRNAPYVSMRAPSAAGALGSTVGDLLAWRRALEDGALLSASSLEVMRSPKTLSSGSSTHYGYGAAEAEFEGNPKITHSGGISGFVSTLSFYPAYELTTAVLVNCSTASPWALDSEIARLVLGLPAIEIKPVELSLDALELYAGTYAMRDQPVPFTIESGRLCVFGQPFVPTGDHSFVSVDDPERKLDFSVGDHGVEFARVIREGLETLYRRER